VHSSRTGSLRFGVFELDLQSGELRKSGLRVKLQPQPVKVLALLASRANEVITREEIQEKVWGNATFVDFEHGLNFCIKQIRATLGDDAGVPHFIETLPKCGYRFIAPVESIGATPGPRQVEKATRPLRHALGVRIRAWVAALVVLLALVVGFNVGEAKDRLARLLGLRASTPIRSLAVLPLKCLSPDPGQEYFCYGMTDALIAELAKIRRLRVPSFTSVVVYTKTTEPLPQIARELEVDGVVEGSVLRSGDKVRITVQLLDGRKDQHLWGSAYEGDMRDVLGLQQQVASAIAREIKVTLTPQEAAHLSAAHSQVNPEAYDAYRHGRFYWYKRNTEGFTKSIGYYEQAITRDPKYAPAYAGLADAYALLGSAPNDELPPRQAMPRAKTAALKALELDDTLAEAHTSLAYIRMSYDWDWPAAEREFHRAIELNPRYAIAHQWYAEFLVAMGRPEEASKEVNLARDADPQQILMETAIAEVFYLSRKYDQVIEQCRQTFELVPNYPLAHFHLGRAYLEKGMYAEAIAEFEQANAILGGRPATTMALGYAHGRAGHKAEARQALKELQAQAKTKYVPALCFVGIYLGLGDTNRALTWLERAYQERSDYLVYLKVEPMADSLRSDPRFADLVRRIGLPP
jgi:TolB-like protein/DNA-binding winged helix-turn-helix (wHTH) protein/Tfp pilus assembly protein PilF